MKYGQELQESASPAAEPLSSVPRCQVGLVNVRQGHHVPADRAIDFLLIESGELPFDVAQAEQKKEGKDEEESERKDEE